MDIQFKNTSGVVGVSDSVFGAKYNESLIHQVITAYSASGRLGTKGQKTRSEVSGGGAKPWKQKGSGRARAGSIRSPIWRGGGVAFAAKARDYTKKINRKMYRAALSSIFSELYRQDRLYLLDAFSFSSNKTKNFISYANEAGFGKSFLLITESLDEPLFLASRNIPSVLVTNVEEVNPLLLLKYDRVILDRVSLEKINEWLL
ncbi:MAG: 50S ribosomal protein L4 [Cardiobacteriaceae bacterium]|nr:50S ribosomal protein L4 [Cardiobacteriaceae bacterium]